MKQQKQEQPSAETPKKRSKLRVVLIVLIAVILAGAAGFSAYKLIGIYSEYHESEVAYRSINDQFVIAPRTPNPNATDSVPLAPGGSSGPAQPVPSFDPSDPNATFDPELWAEAGCAPIGVDFEKLQAVNEECVGWIYIPDTNVSFPVMRAKNNSKYLNRLLDGTRNSAGSIFMDCRCNPDLSDRNVILYGHNMHSGEMFSQLRYYRGKEFFFEHQIGYYLTPDADYEITFVVCKTVNATGTTYSLFEDDEALISYLKGARKHAHVTAEFEPEDAERIFTLSTCTNGGEMRLVLLGIPKKLG